MALGKRSTNQQPRQRRDYVPPLPHPSWRVDATLPDIGGAAQILRARDFWDRLGL
jgi:hypothetical protein